MVNKLVMLVEDDDTIRLMARRIIEREGYAVEDYAHGLIAHAELAKASPNRYRMILSDIDMPKMDGIAFAEECTRLAKDTPVVLMTGRPRESYPANVREVLLKPFGMTEYKRILEKYASRKPQ
ncbi:Regulator of RpoS [uncultured archaeon]|nr:Regulator of RpoS [uncultured archaeon]